MNSKKTQTIKEMTVVSPEDFSLRMYRNFDDYSDSKEIVFENDNNCYLGFEVTKYQDDLPFVEQLKNIFEGTYISPINEEINLTDVKIKDITWKYYSRFNNNDIMYAYKVNEYIYSIYMTRYDEYRIQCEEKFNEFLNSVEISN